MANQEVQHDVRTPASPLVLTAATLIGRDKGIPHGICERISDFLSLGLVNLSHEKAIERGWTHWLRCFSAHTNEAMVTLAERGDILGACKLHDDLERDSRLECSKWLMYLTVEKGDLDIIKWHVLHCTAHSVGEWLYAATWVGRIDVIEWMRERWLEMSAQNREVREAGMIAVKKRMLALSASAYEEHKLNLKKDEVSVSDKDMAMIYEIDSGVPLAAFESLRGLLFKLGNVNSSGTSELGMHAYQAPYVMDIHSIPVKPVPEATSTAFHDVPPKLESAADAQQTYRVVRDAIVSQAYAYHCFSDWRINAAVMVTGEELEIHVAVMRVVPSNCIRVDFHLLQADEMQFLYAVTTIQKQCRAIDMRHLGGPDSRRNVTLPQWSLRSDEFTTSSSLAE